MLTCFIKYYIIFDKGNNWGVRENNLGLIKYINNLYSKPHNLNYVVNNKLFRC